MSQKTLLSPSLKPSQVGVMSQNTMEAWSGSAEDSPNACSADENKDERLLSASLVTISYSEFLFEDMLEHYKSSRGNFQRLRWVLPWLNFASTMLHELGHALFRMRPEPTGVPEEPAILPSTVSEIGFSLEHVVWGGVLDCCNPEGLFVMTDWPSSGLNAMYNHMGTSRASTDAGNIDRTWYLPLAWAQLLFQDDFWTWNGPKLGAQALRAPRISGNANIVESCTCRLERKVAGLEPEGVAITMDKSTFKVIKDPACKIGLCEYHSGSTRAVLQAMEANGVTPEGYLMLWEGTLIAAEYKARVEAAIAKCPRIPAFYKSYWVNCG